MLNYKEHVKARNELYKDMSTNQLQTAKNQWLEMLDSGMRIDQTALDLINRELKKRGEI